MEVVVLVRCRIQLAVEKTRRKHWVEGVIAVRVAVASCLRSHEGGEVGGVRMVGANVCRVGA